MHRLQYEVAVLADELDDLEFEVERVDFEHDEQPDEDVVVDALRVRLEIAERGEFLDDLGEVLDHLFERFFPLSGLVLGHNELLLGEDGELGGGADETRRLCVEDGLELLQLGDPADKGVEDLEDDGAQDGDLEVDAEGGTVDEGDLDDDVQCGLADVGRGVEAEVLEVEQDVEPEVFHFEVVEEAVVELGEVIGKLPDHADGDEADVLLGWDFKSREYLIL